MRARTHRQDGNGACQHAPYSFTLVLTADPSEDEADAMYGTFQDGTISTVVGVPQIHFHREAGSLEEAIRSAIRNVRSTGVGVVRVEIQPDALLQTT